MDACPCSLSPCWTVSSIHDAFCSVHIPGAASRAHHRGDKEQRERGELVQGPFTHFASWSWEQKGAVGTTVSSTAMSSTAPTPSMAGPRHKLDTLPPSLQPTTREPAVQIRKWIQGEGRK